MDFNEFLESQAGAKLSLARQKAMADILAIEKSLKSNLPDRDNILRQMTGAVLTGKKAKPASHGDVARAINLVQEYKDSQKITKLKEAQIKTDAKNADELQKAQLDAIDKKEKKDAVTQSIIQEHQKQMKFDIAKDLAQAYISSNNEIIRAGTQARMLNTVQGGGEQAIIGAIREQAAANTGMVQTMASSIGGAIGGFLGNLPGMAIGTAAGGFLGGYLGRTSAVRGEAEALGANEVRRGYQDRLMSSRFTDSEKRGSVSTSFDVGGKTITMTGDNTAGLSKLKPEQLQYADDALNIKASIPGRLNKDFTTQKAVQYAQVMQNLGFNSNEMPQVATKWLQLSHGKSSGMDEQMAKSVDYTQKYGELTVAKLDDIVQLQRGGMTTQQAYDVVGTHSLNPEGVADIKSFQNSSMLSKFVSRTVASSMGVDLDKALSRGSFTDKEVEGMTGIKNAAEARRAIITGKDAKGNNLILPEIVKLEQFIGAGTMHDLASGNQYNTDTGKPLTAAEKKAALDLAKESPAQKALGDAAKAIQADVVNLSAGTVNFMIKDLPAWLRGTDGTEKDSLLIGSEKAFGISSQVQANLSQAMKSVGTIIHNGERAVKWS